MKEVQVDIINMSSNPNPSYNNESDTCCDLRAWIHSGNIENLQPDTSRYTFVDDDSVFIKPGKTIIIPTGIKVQLPEGFGIMVRPRSGVSVKDEVLVIMGTVDCGYTGEIGIIIHNSSEKPYLITNGDRIAQMCIEEVIKMKFNNVREFKPTTRGSKGFGESGK